MAFSVFPEARPVRPTSEQTARHSAESSNAEANKDHVEPGSGRGLTSHGKSALRSPATHARSSASPPFEPPELPVALLSPRNNVTVLLRDEEGRPTQRLLASAHVLKQSCDFFEGMFFCLEEGALADDLDIPFCVRFDLWARVLRDLHDVDALNCAPHEIVELCRLVDYMGPRDTRIGKILQAHADGAVKRLKSVPPDQSVRLFEEVVTYNMLDTTLGRDLLYNLKSHPSTHDFAPLSPRAMRALLASGGRWNVVAGLKAANTWAQGQKDAPHAGDASWIACLDLPNTLHGGFSTTLARMVGVDVTHHFTTVRGPPGSLRARVAFKTRVGLGPLQVQGDLVIVGSDHHIALINRHTGDFVQWTEPRYFYGGWRVLTATGAVGEGLSEVVMGQSWATGASTPGVAFIRDVKMSSPYGDLIALFSGTQTEVWDVSVPARVQSWSSLPVVSAVAPHPTRSAYAAAGQLFLCDERTMDASPSRESKATYGRAGEWLATASGQTVHDIAWTDTGLLASLEGARVEDPNNTEPPSLALYDSITGDCIWRVNVRSGWTCCHISGTHAAFGYATGEVSAMALGTNRSWTAQAHESSIRRVHCAHDEVVTNGGRNIAVWEL